MKKTILFAIIAIVVVMAACDNTSGKKYNPERRESSMSDSLRKEAIEAQKAALNIDPAAMMDTRNVKLSVLPPAATGDITEDMSEHIGVRMLEMIAANGIGGLNTVPGFALTAKIQSGEKKATGTAPQKMIANYTLSYEVINMATGDVYATASETITGAGSSFEQATRNAIQSIKSTPSVQQMLQLGAQRIIEWFDNNLESFKSQVDAAYGRGDYALCLALIESVPQKAPQAFAYAQGRHQDVLNKFQTQIADKELNEMRQAISAADGAFSKDVYAHMSLIPSSSPQYGKAQELLSNYESAIEQSKQAKTSKEEAEAQRKHALELANIEAERLKAMYQARASEQAIRLHLRDKDFKNRGFWSSLGARIIDAIDRFSGQSNDDVMR